ncbi:MAG: tyrosine-type recombinase/integrase, partial [Myxococcales bacterium]
RGDYRDRSKTTFEQYASEWIRSYPGRTSRGVRDATRRSYAWELGLDPQTFEPLEPRVRAVAYFGRTPVSMIRPRDVKGYATEAAKGGRARDTVRLRLAPLRALLATAVEDDLLDANPAAGVRIAVAAKAEAEEPAERVMALTEEELGRLVGEVCDEHRLLVTLLAQAGLRISEALPLRFQDVDFGRRRLLVRRSLSRGAIGEPKTRHGRRDVPLTSGMARALWAERKRRPGVGDEALLFPGADGFLDRGTVFRAVKAAAKRAEVPWCGLHTLRHTAATILFRRGWNAVQVQKFLGHHSPAFTLATYVHLLDEDLPEPSFLGAATGSLPSARSAEAPTEQRSRRVSASA